MKANTLNNWGIRPIFKDTHNKDINNPSHSSPSLKVHGNKRESSLTSQHSLIRYLTPSCNPSTGLEVL